MNSTPICTIPVFKKRDAVYLLVIIITATLFHFSIAFQGQIPLDEDSLLFFYPLRALHGDANVGYWDPYMFCGFPREANPQAQLLYSPNLIFQLFPTHIGFPLITIAHIVLGAAFMGLLLRGLRLSSEAAFFGAFAFLIGTFWRCKVTNLGLLEGVSWMPGVLYFYLLCLESGRWTPRMAAALLLAMMILAGVPHTVAYALVLLLIATLSYIIFHNRSFFSNLQILITTVGIAALLTIGMWLPALLYLPESARSSLTLSKALEGSIDWTNAWKVFLGGLSQPEISRCDPWEGTCYLGATTLFFLPAGIIAAPRRLRVTLLIAFFFSFLCTLGGDGFLYPLLYRFVPGWSALNLPNRSLILAAIAIPIAAAFGYQKWLERESLPKMRFIVLLTLSIVLITAVFIAVLSDASVVSTLLNPSLTSSFLPDRISDSQWALLSFALWIGLTGLSVLFFTVSKTRKPLSTLLLLALLAAQSALYTPRLFIQTTPSDYFTSPRSVRQAERNSSNPGQRISAYVPTIDSGSDVRMNDILPSLMHRLPEIYRIHDIQGYDPLFPKRYAELVREWSGQSQASDITRTVRTNVFQKRLLDFLSVSTLIGYPNYETLYSGKAVEMGEPGGLESRLKEPKTVKSVLFRWLLAGASHVPQGAQVARIDVMNASSTVQSFPVRAGMEIANYILNYSGEKVRHKPAQEFRWFPIPSENGYINIHQYQTRFNLDVPTEADRVSIEFLSPVGRLAIMQIGFLTNDENGLEIISESSELPVYNNPGAFPPAYLTRRVARYNRLEELIGGFESVSPGEEIPVYFLEDDEIPFETSPVAVPSTDSESVQYKRPHSDRISIQTRSKFDGLLVVSENYSPNWSAKIDGESTPIFRANHTFMALPVSAGEHTIALRYLPRLFFIAISIGGSMLSCVILLLSMYTRRWLLPSMHKKNERFDTRV